MVWHCRRSVFACSSTPFLQRKAMWSRVYGARSIQRLVRSRLRWLPVRDHSSSSSSSLSLPAEEVARRLDQRGLISQTTKIGENPPPLGSGVYVGFDPTADSLHIGNLLAILSLLHFRTCGYKAIAVIGGATGLVGDPSGRTKERDQLQMETLESNLKGISENLSRIFNNYEQLFDSNKGSPIQIFNNADWWREVKAVEFVSDIARHFRVSSMLAKESVKQRLSTVEGLSCAEFLYPIFQAYDFLQLHKHHGCWIQLGGGDQWGNITAGCDFIKRAEGTIVHAVTLPLLTSISGEKLGKSVGNAVWLSPQKTSPYEFYQYFVRTKDQEVERFLKQFTFLPLDEIETILEEHKASPEKFTAQKCLATNITKLVHGTDGLQQALNTTEVLFGNPDALHRLSGEELARLFHDAPTTELPLSMLSTDKGGLTAAQLAVEIGAANSQSFAEGLISRGGFYLNSVRVASSSETVCPERHLLRGNFTVARLGKKNYRLIKWI